MSNKTRKKSGYNRSHSSMRIGQYTSLWVYLEDTEYFGRIIHCETTFRVITDTNILIITEGAVSL